MLKGKKIKSIFPIKCLRQKRIQSKTSLYGAKNPFTPSFSVPDNKEKESCLQNSVPNETINPR